MQTMRYGSEIYRTDSRHCKPDSVIRRGMAETDESKRSSTSWLRTLARFLRHSVQALGVTTPNPRRRLEFCEWVTMGALPDAVEGVLED